MCIRDRNDTVSQFAGLTTPLALFVLGGTLHFSAVKGNLKYLVPSLTVKMVILPAVITVLATAMGFGNLERFVLFTMYATPVATASYSMAQNMGGDGELAGQFVVVSTAASIITIFPVSYTHLDVYKRQDLGNGFLNFRKPQPMFF